MTTNFQDIDFPTTLFRRPRKRKRRAVDLTWNYKSLLSGYQIAMAMPEKLQPGPLAGKISFFAPVSLFFFFFLMLIITTMRGIDLHPMNYFSSLPRSSLFIYFLPTLSITSRYTLASQSPQRSPVFLVVSYLRLVVGIRFASREAALAQFIYLVMFSYAFF